MGRAAVVWMCFLMLSWNAVSEELPAEKKSVFIGADARANTGGEAEANAQTADSEAPSSSLRVTMQPEPTPRPAGTMSFDEMVDRGHALYAEGRYEEAVARYNEARNEKGEDPVTLYFAGCALMKLGRYDEAATVFERMRVSTGATTPTASARALFMIAVLWEARGDDASAVKAWTEYKLFAEAHPMTVMFVSTAVERLRVFEAKAETETKYQQVRERIARERD